MVEPWLWPVALGVLGAVFGSFITTYAIRWPRSALVGRSACDGCGRTLTAVELVPLVSWAWRRGRCATCGGRIALSHPVIEALGLAVGVSAGVVAPGWTGVAGAAFGWVLLALAAVDLAAFRLPNVLTAALAVGGLATGFAGLHPPLVDRLIGGVAGFAALWLIAAAYRQLRGRAGLGGGDAKLLGAIGLWLGWRALPMVVLIACMVGLAIALLRRMQGGDRLPLGALLAPAAFFVWLLTP